MHLRGLGTGVLSCWNVFGPAFGSSEGNIIATAHRDILDNFRLPTLWQQFSEFAVMGVLLGVRNLLAI